MSGPLQFELSKIATDENFEEDAYVAANSDVASAIKQGLFKTGREHFVLHGRSERRSMRVEIDKTAKLESIRHLLRKDMSVVESASHFDFLTPQLREQYDIIDTDAVSAHVYDLPATALIEKHADGVILDCGAGSRNVYFQNVVNLEIALYPSTDVRGVGENLPFVDNSFDAVLSIAVLEHVKNPWLCAREIVRVLKPGGDLFCAVPFLQPEHGYPQHYYNMTALGLRNLFDGALDVVRHDVPDSTKPIFALTWILNSWAAGLESTAREEFTSLKISELMGDPSNYLQRSFVSGLSEEKNRELASATVMHAKKPEH